MMPWPDKKSPVDHLLTTFTSPDGKERVLIVQRPDTTYSYRRQWQSAPVNNDPDSPIFEPDSGASDQWGLPGPYCGIYDSEHTAEQEAFGRISWLASRRPH